MWTLLPAWVEALHSDGYVRVPAVFDTAEVARLLATMDRLALDTSVSAYGRIVHDTWREAPLLARVLLRGAPGCLARAALGARPVLFQDLLVSKPPGTQEAVQWHQDYSYWPLASPRGLTMWVALDDADVGNGCLHYLRGSHRGGERQPADFVKGATQPRRDDLPPLHIAGEIAALEARAGDLLIHDPLVLHMSPPNISARPRRAWSITWVTDAARWAPAHAAHPYLWTLAPQAGELLDPGRFPRREDDRQ